MSSFSQGDLIKISGINYYLLVTSKNAFINATGVFHVVPVVENIGPGPTHVEINGAKEIKGAAICEQVKLIDPRVRRCSLKDRIPYKEIMEVSDVIQGIFEYD
ncbi:MAG: hypothetical protein K6A69_06310 [Lachnospiraceae bacterium]|nr:hypothetical protein [Lachnospiraceae bacterium]